MPTTPYAQIVVTKNGGAPSVGAVMANLNDVVQLSPESSIGWQNVRYEIYAYPNGFGVPAGWTEDTDGSLTSVPGAYYYTATGAGYTPPPFTLSVWGKYLWRDFINNAVNGDNTAQLRDESGGASILSPNGGFPDLANLENGQFGPWPDQVSAALHAIDASIGAGGGGGGGGRTGELTHVMADANAGLTVPEAAAAKVILTSSTALTAQRTITITAPANAAASFAFDLVNNTTGGQSILFAIGTAGTPTPSTSTRPLPPNQSGEFWVDPNGVTFRTENNS